MGYCDAFEANLQLLLICLWHMLPHLPTGIHGGKEEGHKPLSVVFLFIYMVEHAAFCSILYLRRSPLEDSWSAKFVGYPFFF
jgi:hypothetical protein